MNEPTKEKFNMSSLYEEDMTEYTVPVPDCDEETKHRAAQQADNIEKNVTANVHVAEERGQTVPADITVEDR